MKQFGRLWVMLAVLGAAAILPAQTAPPAAQPARPVPAVSYLGIGIQQITSERAKALKLPDESGVEVTRLGPDSPADRAGIKVGDVLLQYNGMRIEGMEQLSRLVRDTAVGRDVRIDLWRNGVMQSVTAKIGQHPAIQGAPDGFGFRLPDAPRTFPGLRSPMLGVEAESIDGQLGQYFGVKEGVLVRSVMRNSAAEKAGIRAGDVIFKIEDAGVGSPADISSHLRSLGGKSVPVGVMRDRKELTVNVIIEAGPAR